MKSNYTEVAAAWIVAVALIAAIAAHTFLPATPPDLSHGAIPAAASRVGVGAPASDTDLPLVEAPETSTGNTKPRDGSDLSLDPAYRSIRG
ncbi:MAG TPA: hypothetical protein VGB82_03640 [Alphaproteobacteria bacterium]